MSDSKIRWSSIAEPETPPAARVYMWYDLTDQIFKIKRDDGIAEPLVGGSIITNTVTLKCQVRNITGATIPKRSVVYINGASGNLPTINYAQGNSESTSSKTFGITETDILHNGVGYVVVDGKLSSVNTSMFNAGDLLWLSPTVPGGLTTTKPFAPDHMVFCAYVTRAHPTDGELEVKIQNGFELQELHNVQILTPTNGQILIYDAATSLWKNQNLVIPTPPTHTVEYFTLSPAQIASGAVTLSHTPTSPTIVTLDVISGSAQYYGDDYTVSGTTVSWAANPLYGILIAGDKIRITYTY